MHIIDLTHEITEGMPVYPGTEGPRLTAASTYERDGFKETLITMYTHTGTHMDPPAHVIAGATTLDRLPADRFVGTALVVDCLDVGEGQRMTMEHIERCGSAADDVDFLLFHTGWDRFWDDGRYFGDYPCIDEAVATYLLDTHKKGIGLDTIGIDPIADETLTLHRMLFERSDMVIIENLTNLAAPGSAPFTFCALPLKLHDADGSPVRAIAMMGE